jgi:hypothetical protein
MRPADTSPEAWKLYLDLQRRLTPGEKIARAIEHSEFIREMAKAGVRSRYPHASEEELHLRFARLMLGAELFCKVYGNVLTDEPAQDVR